MSVWSHITGVIHLEDSVTESEMIAYYNRISHYITGSEGGLDISFTRTRDKDWEGNKEYRFEPYTKISNMVIQGSLRSFTEDYLLEAIEALKEFLYILKDKHIAKRASFTFECDDSNNFYQVSLVKNRIRTKKITVK